MKTQNKIILFLTSIFLAYILVFSGFIYFSISDYSYTDFYKRLEIRAITMAKIELEDDQDINAVKEIRQDFLEELPNEKITIIDLQKFDIHTNSNLSLSKSFLEDIVSQERAYFKENNTFYSGIKYHNRGKDYLVIVSAENYYNTHHIVYLRNLLLIALLISILIIIFIAWFFSRKVLQPIQSIIGDMKKINTENLNFRLKETEDNEELRSLTATFNNMLNRLETSFETQKNFISNASHELNTPLTSIIGEAEVTLAKERAKEEYIVSLNTILEEAGKLDKKTKALLFLAQTGYDGKAQTLSPLRIDELVIDVKETVEKIYPEAVIHLDFDLLPENPEKLSVNGNGQLLHLAISNVVMNACKYSNNEKVIFALSASDNEVIIRVEDQGIGIPEADLPYIFDPFFRARNTENFHGYGIGLPLSRNVIKMHKGSLIAHSKTSRGTSIEIRLPIGF
ncbi:HAMP domain-containing sensor histidine kinase [Zunongwangia sp. HGR-M22]|uniref:HAMP domain-containing sensor histidine kinase n=1 Tax=Zunongwangia sp. HGR-M22 TaxID=3015168 RepID=UPI0022DD9C3B|nr:HAMP domain-containing sensor histidine kinase [Zunongwangia sp. HGR-M22]WBL26544.1 HAMP domain-containing sensor histidine kinase [Zunongwangia sp. HGR-M22]